MISKFIYLFVNKFFSIRPRMFWNIGDIRNLFLMLKLKLGLYHVVPTSLKTSLKKHTLSTIVGMQQLPDIEITDSREEISRLSWTIYNVTRKVCVNIQTDTDKLKSAVYH